MLRVWSISYIIGPGTPCHGTQAYDRNRYVHDMKQGSIRHGDFGCVRLMNRELAPCYITFSSLVIDDVTTARTYHTS